jgi:hypothetical protein
MSIYNYKLVVWNKHITKMLKYFHVNEYNLYFDDEIPKKTCFHEIPWNTKTFHIFNLKVV